MSLFSQAFGLVIYLLLGRLLMRRSRGRVREAGMAGLNMAGVFIFLFFNHDNGGHAANLAKFALYIFIVVLLYIIQRQGAAGRPVWPAFFAPITVLIFIRHAFRPTYLWLGHELGEPWGAVPGMVGISYLTFRCSRLVLEVRNGSAPAPGFWQYLNFAFFLPTMSVGPINSYANFQRGFAAEPWAVPAGRAALRVLLGLIKYEFLSVVFGQLTYSALLLTGLPHHWIDLPVVMVFYYLHLYCNFSGFCDMAIGAAGLIGIPVPENFNNPFAARNVKDFWNRWHITLSQWMRDIVFAPLSKYLVRVMGPTRVNHAIALAIFVVFLLIGIWHGTGWNYVIFGGLQALGVVTTHYYTIWLKQRLGREGFKAYNENRWIHATAVTITFCYYAASLMFFANTLPEIKEIFQTLR